MRQRFVAVTAGALGLFTLSTGIANAATYRGEYSISFTTEAACAAASAARNDPPDAYSYPCETVMVGDTTEWHYWYKYLIS